MQLVPLPRMKPLQPSSFHIFASAGPTDSLYASRPTLCTCRRIFNRSSGDTTVLDTAPATPPPQNAATTGCDILSLNATNLWSGAAGGLAAFILVCMVAPVAGGVAGACSCDPLMADMAGCERRLCATGAGLDQVRQSAKLGLTSPSPDHQARMLMLPDVVASTTVAEAMADVVGDLEVTALRLFFGGVISPASGLDAAQFDEETTDLDERVNDVSCRRSRRRRTNQAYRRTEKQAVEWRAKN